MWEKPNIALDMNYLREGPANAAWASSREPAELSGLSWRKVVETAIRNAIDCVLRATSNASDPSEIRPS